MYNFSLVNSTVVLGVLYLLIEHGHEVPAELKASPDAEAKPAVPESAAVVGEQADADGAPVEEADPHGPPLPSYVKHDPRIPTMCDPPDDCFRLTLAVTLLKVCGTYFTARPSRGRLERYLTFLQRCGFL